MDSGRLIFDPAASHRRGRMLVLGGGAPGGNPIFRGARSVFGMEEGANKLRPFFTSPDQEIFEEEYYDEQIAEKKRRLTAEQVHMLERSFESENKLEPERKSELARKLGLQQRQVAVWFQNRRARWKTKQLERDFDRLKSSYDALLTDRDALVKDNDCLRSQVISLSEMLQAKELPAAEKPDDDQLAAAAGIGGITVNIEQKQEKVEDRLSTGSGGSAVVDSSGDSYFHDSYHDGGGDQCYVGVISEEDEGSDGGCSYLPSGIFSDQQSNECLWVWN